MPPLSPSPTSGMWPGLGSVQKPQSQADVLRKAHARLAERFDPAKTKHKPQSIVRQEARRTLEQFFELEMAQTPKAERDKIIDDILNEAIGFGPLEELFRDETVKEIMVLGFAQIIAFKNERWTPTSTRFRDAGHFSSCLTRWLENSEQLVKNEKIVGGSDVRLGNGFRVITIVPPDVMEQPPQALFLRGEAVPTGGSSIVALKASTRTVPTAPPVSTPAPKIEPPAKSAPISRTAQTRVMPAPDFGPTDPYAKLRQRVSTWIIQRCAAAGVFDLSQIPTNELQKVIQAHIQELCTTERFHIEPTVIDRLVLEILSSMNR